MDVADRTAGGDGPVDGGSVGGVAADDDDDPDRSEVDVEPVGDAGLLADLGVPAHTMLAWCVGSGVLPADMTAEVCERLGCADEVEALRGA